MEADLMIWRRFKAGDESAFITIYERYVNILFQLGIQFTPDDDLVKDCLQDFFIALRQKRQNLSDTDDIRLYLFKAFRRRLCAYLKKKTKFIDKREYIAHATSFPIELAADEKIINAQFDDLQLQKLNNALQKLPSKEREALYYFYFQNMSYQEIAVLFNYDHVSSARRLMYKSLRKLRKLLLAVAGLMLDFTYYLY
jgi:RNA polymerase sigma-70 factor (ECF subfamily)